MFIRSSQLLEQFYRERVDVQQVSKSRFLQKFYLLVSISSVALRSRRWATHKADALISATTAHMIAAISSVGITYCFVKGYACNWFTSCQSAPRKFSPKNTRNIYCTQGRFGGRSQNLITRFH